MKGYVAWAAAWLPASAVARRLQLEQFRVSPARGDQLIVGAELAEPPALDHRDLVGRPDRREAVGDHDARPPVQVPAELREDDGLGLGDERDRRPGENPDVGAAEDKPGERHALPL